MDKTQGPARGLAEKMFEEQAIAMLADAGEALRRGADSIANRGGHPDYSGGMDGRFAESLEAVQHATAGALNRLTSAFNALVTAREIQERRRDHGKV